MVGIIDSLKIFRVRKIENFLSLLSPTFFTLIYLFLWFYAVNQSLWLDEATTARVVSQYSFFEIPVKFSPSDFHPPLYYLFMKLWHTLFPINEVFLRLPSLLFVLLSFYLLLRNLNPWAGYFLLFNPLIFYYSLETRMYALVVFLFTLSFVLFVKNKINFWFYLSLFLAFLSFYGSIFFILTYLVYFLIRRRKSEAKRIALLLFLAVLLLSPLLLKQLSVSAVGLSSYPGWAEVLGKGSLKNLVLIFIKLGLGRVRFPENNLYYLEILVLFSFIYAPLLFYAKSEKMRRIFFFFFFPVFLGFIFSFFKPVLQYFRFIYLVVVLSFALSLVQSRSYKVLILIFFFLPLTVLSAFDIRFYREDWKGFISTLPAKSKVVLPIQVSDPVWFYSKSFKKNIDIYDLKQLSDLKGEVYVVQYAAYIFGLDFEKLLQDYKILEQKKYRGNIIVYKLNL